MAELRQSPPGRRHLPGGVNLLPRMTRPQQSRLVLSGSGLVASSALLTWLLLLALLARPRPELVGIWAATPGGAATPIHHQAADLRGFTGRADSESGTALEDAIRERLAGPGSQPLVLYLSAAGVAGVGGSDFLRPAPVAAGREPLSVEWLIERMLETAARRNVLLILDAGQVGSDRGLHVFGNGFLASFKARLQRTPSRGLAVLCSCAPGQTSWESEADRRSAFGYYVARGLEDRARGWDGSSPHVTVRALASYVRHRVERWVRANRGAVQTPMLLGDPSVNFVLPRLARPRTEGPSPGDEADATRLARLDEEWSRHDELRALRPYRHAPVRWRNYQDVLLRAERAIRAGAAAEADGLMDGLAARRKAIAGRSAGLPADAPWSLALLERSRAGLPPDPAQRGEAIEAGALEKALEELIGGRDGAKEPPAASPRPAAEGRRVTDLPDLVEAQLLHWARTFTGPAGATGAFLGPRGERLRDAQKLRRLAERAAAADDRVGPWVAPLVEAGDEVRRQAQDALFVNDPPGLHGVGRLLERAGARYREALEVGDRVAVALDLIEEIESELPDYGEWQARRGGGDVAEGLGSEVLDVLNATATLAATVQALPADQPRADAGLDAHLDRARALDGLIRDARAAFDRLRSVFKGEAESLATSAGLGRWREIDAVLRVPVIPAGLRRSLLRRIRSPEIAASLEEGQHARDDPPPRGIVTSDDSSALLDRDFRRQALGLARLELGLLEIGGAPEAGLDRLRDALTAARVAINNGSSDGIVDLMRVGARIRAARTECLDAAGVRPGRSSDLAALIAADRALRVALVADTPDRVDTACHDVARLRRHDRLLWHGRRLLSDFDPDRARRLLEAARRHGESKALSDAFGEAFAMDHARLSPTTDADGTIAVPARSERPLGVRVSPAGPVPPGRAAVLVGYDPSRPLTVTEQASRRDARDGVLVDVGLGEARDRRERTFLVARSEPGPTTVAAELIPRVFYRGRLVDVGRGVAVSLLPASDPVSITIGQSYKDLPFKNFTDQFKEHPGQGYLHYGTNLQYKLVLKSEEPVRAVVRYGLKERPGAFKEQTVALDPKQPFEIHDALKGDDFSIDRADGKLVIPPLNLEITVSKDLVNGPRLGETRYTFRMIPPEEYVETKWDYDPTQRLLTLMVTHLASDKATGPVEVVASIGGQGEKLWIPRSRWAFFRFAVPPGERKVRWRVGVESMPQAFTGVVETQSPAPEGAPAGR